MKVCDLTQLFGLHQYIEMYGNADPKYPDEFMGEDELNLSKPLYEGRLSNMPFQYSNCEIYQEPSYPILETRVHKDLPGAMVLIFMINEDDTVVY